MNSGQRISRTRARKSTSETSVTIPAGTSSANRRSIYGVGLASASLPSVISLSASGGMSIASIRASERDGNHTPCRNLIFSVRKPRRLFPISSISFHLFADACRNGPPERIGAPFPYIHRPSRKETAPAFASRHRIPLSLSKMIKSVSLSFRIPSFTSVSRKEWKTMQESGSFLNASNITSSRLPV